MCHALMRLRDTRTLAETRTSSTWTSSRMVVPPGPEQMRDVDDPRFALVTQEFSVAVPVHETDIELDERVLRHEVHVAVRVERGRMDPWPSGRGARKWKVNRPA